MQPSVRKKGSSRILVEALVGLGADFGGPSRVLGAGCWVLVLGAGCWVLGAGCRVPGAWCLRR